ncbi:MAG: hypothetical protein G01um101493_64 [Microgenomates group bacterium Gr01-1014_93]|nr:MAG: hypothetical protein G01um101493_64 [Microgenomates group bacterium Gr01-1014_93]
MSIIIFKGVIKLELLWYFLAGAFHINALPHLVKGITGQTHMTPFAKVSSPVVNIVWGFVNVVVALFLLGIASGQGGLILPWSANLVDLNLWAYLGGAGVNALFLAWFWSNPNAKLPWQ